MPLSEKLAERVHEIAKHQSDYKPNEVISRVLGTKSLLMLVGPAAIGKTYIMNNVAKEYGDFKNVTSFTTRPKEARDAPDTYNYFENTDESVSRLLDRIDQKEIVQYAVHPTTGFIYGSMITDYHAKYNMLDTLSGSVEQLKKIGFEKTITYGIVSDPNEWEVRFNQRYPSTSDERQKRAKEAKVSLRWLLDQEAGNVTWLFNRTGDPHGAALQLVDTAETTSVDTFEHLRDTAEDMYRIADTL